ncbi:MAG: accessory Sec system translocase SecA2 [Streptosporangiales bacterium]|nr:accessory Sec system translocase SecA2 [Streptosporangiales bacterium]
MTRLRERVRRLLQKPGTIDISPYRALVEEAGRAESRVEKLSDAELTEAAAALRDEDALFDAAELAKLCAVGREAARRGLDERPFDVQLIGTLGLLNGNVVEMATGEGKTLSGALAAAGYALQGRRVHVISVNDYLARRDAEWMKPVYDLMGVSVAWIGQESTDEERRAAYAADVTYGSVSEIGFDVLRDRLRTSVDDLVQPEPDVAIVDEADSVLIDEAKVPLVLAGAVATDEGDAELAEIIAGLEEDEHYEVDADRRSVHLTPEGTEAVEEALGGIDLYAQESLSSLTGVNVALHAHALLRRDVDYIVRDDRVELINESRGRVARLQRWPDGLQAAVEAKEKVSASETGEVLDSITVQALIRRYPQVAGMTGTAVAVGEQLREFYNLEVAAVPPNTTCIRGDEPDRLYATVKEKEAAVVEEIVDVHATGRPILVGTQDVAESERLARLLEAVGVECVVLNAKNDAEEAAIIAEAGASASVTVSTQMAGRGTDIRLGGSAGGADRDRVAGLNGLYVIGTGRYPSSRLDDQLRGRAGRQGDPGGSVFFTSLEDDLVEQNVTDPPPAEEPDEDGRITGAKALWTVEHAQRVAEGQHLEIHRNTWRYNRLTESQRDVMLADRAKVLRTGIALERLEKRCPERVEELREAGVSDGTLTEAARQIVLHHLDRCWAEHLGFLADLREGIHLRSLGRRDPLDEYQRQAIPTFRELADQVDERSEETFTSVTITEEDGADLTHAGLKRPTSTWTYLVKDNPFGSEGERFLRGFGRRR